MIIRILGTFHNFNSFLVFIHVYVHLILFKVIEKVRFSMVEVTVLFVGILWNSSITVPETALSRGSRRSTRLRIIVTSCKHSIIPRSILTVKHLVWFLVDCLCAPEIHALFLLKHSPLLLYDLLVGWVSLFKPLRVPQCILCVVTRGGPRANACKHNDLHFVTGEERISQHHRQLTRSEGHVLTLSRLAFLSVDGTHTLFQA